ncbi:hypothetical protein ACFX2B_040675 [Malus domestica]
MASFSDGVSCYNCSILAFVVLGIFVQGLAYLHSKDIVHGDLKADNIFVLDDVWKRIEEHMSKSFGGVSKLFRPGVFRGILEELFGSSGGHLTADSILSCFGGLKKLAVAGEST